MSVKPKLRFKIFLSQHIPLMQNILQDIQTKDDETDNKKSKGWRRNWKFIQFKSESTKNPKSENNKLD